MEEADEETFVLNREGESFLELFKKAGESHCIYR